MVKVLIVDDDRMARQGLILSIRWEAFGMRVVGEAPNGLKALQFLDEHPVDLVLTDLAMPVMSGIDLMKRARQSHPEVLFVVLTFHEDFDSTREALRLGAIDYLSKLQLEKENLDLVLARIRDRFAAEPRRAQPTAGGDRAVVFFPMGPESDPSALTRLLIEREAVPEDIAQGGLWWRLDAGALEWPADLPAPRGWFVVRLQGLLGEPRSRIEHVVRQYQGTALFYDYRPEAPLFDAALEDLIQTADPLQPEPATAEFRSRLCSLEWMHHDKLFQTLLGDLRAARLAQPTLLRLLAAVENDWTSTYGPWAAQQLEMPSTFRSWSEVESWLVNLRDFTYGSPVLKNHSPEAQTSTLRALRIIHTEYATPLKTAEVAARVHLSRSHFCLCFKEMVGVPFLDYLSRVRLDQARKLLETFDGPVYEVAQRCGYADERYFGRRFKEATGQLPGEYRKRIVAQRLK